VPCDGLRKVGKAKTLRGWTSPRGKRRIVPESNRTRPIDPYAAGNVLPAGPPHLQSGTSPSHNPTGPRPRREPEAATPPGEV
jgi:hypothetical protein